MRHAIVRFIREDDGQDLIEYAFLAVFIALAVVSILGAVGTSISSQYSNIGTATGTPVTPTGGSIPGATPVTATNPDHYYGTLSIGDFYAPDVHGSWMYGARALRTYSRTGFEPHVRFAGGGLRCARDAA